MSRDGMVTFGHLHRRYYLSRSLCLLSSNEYQLSKAHPQEEIRLPPAKDKTYVSAPTMSPITNQHPVPPSPLSYSSTFDDPSARQNVPPSSPTTPYSRLSREKNRLTLRSYLRSLLHSSSAIASSPVLRHFLSSRPITLTRDELEDCRRREEADSVREEGRKKFAKEIAGRVDGLRDVIKGVKGDIMGKGLHTYLFHCLTVPDHVSKMDSRIYLPSSKKRQT